MRTRSPKIDMIFYLGIRGVATNYAWAFRHCMLSLNYLWDKYNLPNMNHWMLDSGGYTQIAKYGHYICSPKWYAWRINRLKENGILDAACVQDWQCGDRHLMKSGKS